MITSGKDAAAVKGRKSVSNSTFVIERERFYINDQSKYLIRGVLPEKYTVEAALDGEAVPVEVSFIEGKTAMERFQEEQQLGGKRIEALLTLPENLGDYKKLEVFAVCDEEKQFWFRMRTRELLLRKNRPQFFIEQEIVSTKERSLKISGWTVAGTPVSIKLFDEKKKPVNCDIQRTFRKDVADVFSECSVEDKTGFIVDFHGIYGKYMYLVMRDENGAKSVHRIRVGTMQIMQGKADKYRKKGMEYLKSYGVKAFAGKVINKFYARAQRPMEYSEWLPKHLPSETVLKKQQKKQFAYMPKISFVVPLYKTNLKYLDELIQSVKKQSYENWELCLSDGSGENSPLTKVLEKYVREDKRIKVVSNEKQLHISENTNAALEIATGDFIAFGDHDDLLTLNAFYECVKAVNENPDTEIIYSDEDKVVMEGDRFFQPHFKPDFNIDLLHTTNYICHLFVVKRELLEKVGGLNPEFDGAQDYDFVFRCVEASDRIYHIPKILYHWRSHQDSTAENPESKKYAFEAGKRAIQAHYDRVGIKAAVENGEFYGLYRTKYQWDENPLISILIPNKDHIEDLERCISSIEEKSTYKNYEYIIIENNSTEEETFAYYKELEAKNEKVKVVYWDGVFNYSDINNFGASFAGGEYLLLLNNDTEVINGDWLEEMLGYCMRKDVGIVGARLYYADDTIQHAGVVMGFGGIAGHCFVQQPRYSGGYFNRVICAQNYSAVTAACMMVKKSVFDEVGGLSSVLAVAFNDIDFCLKVRHAGYLVVYNPYAELYHYESKSRGLEDTPEKQERFRREIAKMEELWPDVFRKPDPYYNPNLTLASQDFSLKRI